LKKDKKGEYSEFQRKITGKFCFSAFVSVLAVMGMYVFPWRKRAGDWIVDILENVGNMPHEDAFMIYHSFFRGNKEILFTIAIIAVFLLLLWRSFRWMTRYFNEIKEGIDSLLCQETEQIILSPEMLPFERKLNAVKQTLEKQEQETALAEQHKDELVVYLAHDIRTPLTSVIGYLNLLEENPEMPTEERMKNVHITLEKAYRLEEMVQELFEITRYHSHQIRLIKEKIDLYYMLVQLSDEMVPVLKKRGNSVILDVDEEMMVFADPDKLARVFSNILKNAAVYSYPDTPIRVSAFETDAWQTILFCNEGDTIPEQELSAVFDKFYRMDKARSSDTGDTGLGLAIAKDIMLLHEGDITAFSEDYMITFSVRIPKVLS